jgi:putative hemolysin
MKRWLLVAWILVMPLLAACGAEPTTSPFDSPLEEPSTFDSPLGLPNPASQFCEEQGYTLELREEAEGVAGYCLFPDGSECEEWAYYRGECGPETTGP